jgi:hypothetical protein
MNYFVDLDEQILTIIPIQSSDRQKTELKIFRSEYGDHILQNIVNLPNR